MSNSEHSENSLEKSINSAIADYYRQIERGLKVDHQAFLRQHPAITSQLSEFFSNIGIFEFSPNGPALPKPAGDVVASGASDQTSHSFHAGRDGNVVQEAVMLRDYRILECIGQGGMGSVYRALHVHLQKYVAIKTLNSERMNSPEAVLRFSREMRLLAQLEHSNIVQVLDAGEYEGKHFFVMELVTGIDLSQLVKRLGPLPIPETTRIISLAAQALQYAHDQKILHRDVKPSNLMLTANGSVKLLDLGLAHVFEKDLDDQITHMDQAVGTLAYMAPEQLANSHGSSNQSDVFSLGVSLHELLSGKRPCFQSGSIPLVADIRAIRPDLNDELCQLLDQMLSLSPADRPQSMSEVVDRLNRFATTADLEGLVAEYYRWNNRAAMVPTPPPVYGDTVEIPVAKQAICDLAQDQTTRATESTRSRLESRSKRAAGYVLAGLASVAATVLYFWFSSSPVQPIVSQATAPPVSEPVGQFEIVNSEEDELIAHIITEGNLRIRQLTEGDEEVELLGVKEGLNDVAPGHYELLIPGPVDFKPVPFEITKDAVTKVTPEILLKNYFQFPVLPVAGKFAGFHGTVTFSNGQNPGSIPFDLHLMVLADEPEGPGLFKWLKLEVISSLESGTYQEVGYLKIDADEWARGQLSVQEGWVEASGDTIKQFVYDRLPVGQETLVVKFDPTKDLLKGLANFTLPEGRLSVQDMLVLFFGDNHVAAANEAFTKLRPKLSATGERHVWLERRQLDNGMVECYVASSRSRDEKDSVPGWRIARSRENPFEIAELEVNAEIQAKCTTRVSGKQVMDAGKLRQTLEDLATRAIDPAKLAQPHAFDQAKIPDEPSSFSAAGTITTGGQPQAIEFTVSMLGLEEVDGRKLHWLEVDLTTDPAGVGHREIARLLVDASEYPRQLNIQQGWFAFDNGSIVLPVPKNGDLESVINARLQLSTDPRFNGTNVVDLIWMLFKTDFTPKSRLADLRSFINNLIKDRVAKAVALPSKKNGELQCVQYEPRAADPALVTYQIHRCSQIPFGLAKVRLEVPKRGLSIHLNLESYLPAGLRVESALGPNDIEHMTSLEAATAQQLLATDRPNWRIWTWADPGKTYKVWAEFGGTVLDTKPAPEEFVLLWDDSRNERRIPLSCLSDTDKQWVKQGRLWSTGLKPRLVLMDIVDGDQLRLGSWNASEKKVTPFPKLFPKKDLWRADSEWVNRYMTSKRTAKPDDWERFATYIR